MKYRFLLLIKIIFAIICLLGAISSLSSGILSSNQPFVVRFIPILLIVSFILTMGNLIQKEIDNNKNNK